MDIETQKFKATNIIRSDERRPSFLARLKNPLKLPKRRVKTIFTPQLALSLSAEQIEMEELKTRSVESTLVNDVAVLSTEEFEVTIKEECTLEKSVNTIEETKITEPSTICYDEIYTQSIEMEETITESNEESSITKENIVQQIDEVYNDYKSIKENEIHLIASNEEITVESMKETISIHVIDSGITENPEDKQEMESTLETSKEINSNGDVKDASLTVQSSNCKDDIILPISTSSVESSIDKLSIKKQKKPLPPIPITEQEKIDSFQKPPPKPIRKKQTLSK